MSGIKKAGGISFGVSMSTGMLAKDVKKARSMMGGFVKGTTSMLSSWQGQVASLLGVGALTSWAKSTFDSIDKLHESAKTLGLTTQALGGLAHAAEQNGSSQATLESGLSRMVKTTRDATLGMETASRAYEKLGLNAAELHKLSPDRQFTRIAEAIKNLKSEQDQLTVTQDIFGRGNKDLVETLRLGTDGLASMRSEAESLGKAINSVDAAKIAKAADELDKAKKTMQATMNQVVVEHGPGVANFASRVATGFSRMTGGEAGENAAEASLRKEMERRAFNQETLAKAAQARFDMKHTKERARAQVAEAKKAQGKTGAKVGGFLGNIGSGAADFASGIMTGKTQAGLLQNLSGPLLMMQQKLAIAGLDKNRLAAAESAKTNTRRKFSGVSDFNSEQSGSLAAYQQKIRGGQQFDKVEQQQLKAQQSMDKNIGVIAARMPVFSNMGAN